LEEGDGGVVELCEFQRLPPPLTQENPVISFIWGTIKIKVGRNRAIIFGTKISKKGISPKNQKKSMKAMKFSSWRRKNTWNEKKRRQVEIVRITIVRYVTRINNRVMISLGDRVQPM
jgi:hypothetical protein